jgi:hypothetical protein
MGVESGITVLASEVMSGIIMCRLLIYTLEELRTLEAFERVELLVMFLQGDLVAKQYITLLTFVCVDLALMNLAFHRAAEDQGAVFASKLGLVVFFDMLVQISLLIEAQRTFITLETEAATRGDMLLHFCICVELFCAFGAFGLVDRRLDMGR